MDEAIWKSAQDREITQAVEQANVAQLKRIALILGCTAAQEGNMARTKTITKRTKGKRGGRPAIDKEKRRSKTFTFRIGGNIHKRVAEAASKSGRSVTEEVEHRLERSLLLTEVTELLEAARLVCRATCVHVGPSKDVRVGAPAEIVSKDDTSLAAGPESVRVDPRPAAAALLDPFQKACDAIATVLEVARAEEVKP